jgi:hypothetical protein
MQESCTPDEDRISKAKICTFNTCQGNRQGFAERAFLERHFIGQTVKPLSWMQVPSCQCPFNFVNNVNTKNAMLGTYRGMVE